MKTLLFPFLERSSLLRAPSHATEAPGLPLSGDPWVYLLEVAELIGEVGGDDATESAEPDDGIAAELLLILS